MIDKWLFRQISGESVVIAASHPWLQADKWGILGSRPDSKIGESYTAQLQIRSAVWQLDASPCDLIVKYQCVVVKHVVLNLTGAILQLQSGLFFSLGRAALQQY